MNAAGRTPAAPAFPFRATLTLAAAFTASALAVWLLPASLHIADWPRNGPHRIAVFAPLYRLWMIGAVTVLTAVVLFAARRRVPGGVGRVAHVLAPLNLLWLWTLPYWPWLAERLPLLIALAGPLRWIFAAMALGAVVARAVRPARFWRGALPGRRTAFALSLVVSIGFGLRSLATVGLGGDEPHYLVITHSLLVDRDLKIENNHAAGDYRAFFRGDLRPDYLQRGTDAEIYSIHAPGLSVLLLPGYAIDGARGAVVTVSVLAALAGLAVFDMAMLVSTAGVAWLTWAAICLTVPFIPHAWGLYPEMPGAAIVAWAVLWGMRASTPSAGVWFWRGASLAGLPWLHTKFTVFLAGLTLFLLWRLRDRWRSAIALLAPIAFSGAAWLGFFYVIYGSLDPQAPYGGYAAQFVRLENVPRSLFGLLFDQKFGILVYAPIYAWALAGAPGMARNGRWRPAAVASLLLALAYTLSSARLYMWWGGSSAPARFLVPVAPLLAPALAMGIARARGKTATTTLAACVCISLLVGFWGAIGAEDLMLYSAPHGVSRMLEWLQGSAPLTASFPTFTELDWVAPALALAPWLAALAVAAGAGWLCARAGASGLWIASAQMIVFAAVGAALLSSFSTAVRAESQSRGALALLTRFDPARARAFDYARLGRMSPQDWLGALTMTFDREPGTEPDRLGRLTAPLRLPPGRYEARVWFEGERPRGGAFMAALGNGYLVARLDEPLSNPAVLTVPLPIEVPALWMQLTDQASARSVRRLEIVALSVTPASERLQTDVTAVEAFDDRLNAYVVYLDRFTYPEHGVFWTRGRERGRLLLAPAGAGTVAMTLHVGPIATTVTVRVGERTEHFALAPEETRTIRLPLPPAAAVPIDVQASASFRPVDVDPSSSDTRHLGCQVRLVLD